MNRLNFIFITLACLSGSCFGQNWLDGDCDHANPVVGVFYDFPVYNIPAQVDSNELGLSSCISSGEQDGRWFEFLVLDSGTLCFNIIPYMWSNDYDWALFNITGDSCLNIRSNPSLQVSCNYSNSVTNGGATGANNGTNYQDEPTLHVDSGQYFKLYLHNFSGTTSGFQLDFSCSTCSFNTIIGLNKNISNLILQLGPNPTYDLLNLYFDPEIIPIIRKVELIDIHGRVLYQQTSDFIPQMSMNLSLYVSGIYNVRIFTDQRIANYRIIKN